MLLSVTDLHAQYGRIPILNGVRLDVAAGELVGVLGHNGMGKTTLLKTLMGFVSARRGRVVFDGTDITHEPPNVRARRGIGYVPQGRDIFPGLSVRDNLRMGFAGQGAEERLEGILETFPRLAPLLNRRGGALSGGEQQLLAIARCLAGNPRLVFFDEPTEGIQPSIVEDLLALLRRLHLTQGLTIVLVEQNLEFIAELSNRVLLIQKGTILRELQPGELLQADVLSEFVGVAVGGQSALPNEARPASLSPDLDRKRHPFIPPWSDPPRGRGRTCC